MVMRLTMKVPLIHQVRRHLGRRRSVCVHLVLRPAGKGPVVALLVVRLADECLVVAQARRLLGRPSFKR